MDAEVGEVDLPHRHAGLGEITGGAIVVGGVIGGLAGDDEHGGPRQIDELAGGFDLAPAAHQIGLCGRLGAHDRKRVACGERRIVGDRDVAEAGQLGALGVLEPVGRPQILDIVNRRAARLDRQDRLDELGARVRDRPAEGAGLRMGEQDPKWPQARLHTQFPGAGKPGDPDFDQFYASQFPSIASFPQQQQLNRDALVALLDKIGPAIVLTHSQSGPFGWLIADARPNLVKGIVAIEPSGPPFENTIIGTGKARAWGPTDIALTYDPPVKDPSEISVKRDEKPDGPNMFLCWMQAEPARRLVNLKNIPTVVISAEASYHQLYDNCTVKYLNQAGMKVEWMPLQNKGIHGNGHMVMIEKNNLDIAKLIDNWVAENVK